MPGEHVNTRLARNQAVSMLMGEAGPAKIGMLERFAADNARRVPCAQCDMRVLPESMARHIEIHHTED